MSETEYMVLVRIPASDRNPPRRIGRDELVAKRAAGPQRIGAILDGLRQAGWISGEPWALRRTPAGDEAVAEETRVRERLLSGGNCSAHAGNC